MGFKKLFKHNKLPLVINRGMVLFPKISFKMEIRREGCLRAAKKALENNGLIIVVAQKNNLDVPDRKDVYTVGVICKIIQYKGQNTGDYEVYVEALEKVKIIDFQLGEECFARYRKLEDVASRDKKKSEALLNDVKSRILTLYGELDINVVESFQLDEITDPSLLTDFIAMSPFFDLKDRQEMLEEINIDLRMERLLYLIDEMITRVNSQKEHKQNGDPAAKSQRKTYLKQQLEEIKKELGEGESSSPTDFSSRIDSSGMPDQVRMIAESEIKRLETLSSHSVEYNIIKNYLEWLFAMPWNRNSLEQLEISLVKEQLNKDHFGLEKVKKRIVEYLAVRKLKARDLPGPIICLVGPPGVGKTSLAYSIAKSLNREFVRVSLGGVRDEAEIRGHRRTYIGAMPGKVVQSIKRAKTKNPLLLLDEVDKLVVAQNGDPGSALLEVLDPEQNNTFLDHYLDVPFDLSQVFFVATANYPENIPAPLRDRMEMIYLSSYTLNEKYHIAKEYIIPAVMEDNAITHEMIKIDDLSVVKIINNYTRESGVRELRRLVASICRNAAMNWLENKTQLHVDDKGLEKILGPAPFEREMVLETNHPGVINGLAWTPVGGDLLFIETTLLRGGATRLQLTGQLGAVMRESAQIALTFLKANAERFKINIDLMNKSDFHIHVPAGAIKKDGPSAGVTIFTSLASILLDRSVSNQVAMTGEITLKGQVTAVGGIKEKIIAAHSAGIKKVLLSWQNEKDVLNDVPEEVRNDLEFKYVKDLYEAFDYLFPQLTQSVVLSTEESSSQPNTQP